MARGRPSHPSVHVPAAPALVAGVAGTAWISAEGEVESLGRAEIAARIEEGAVPLVCHRLATAKRLGVAPFPAYDLLELFAFVRPARFCVPTPRGLAQALGIKRPERREDEAALLAAAAHALLAELARSQGNGDALAVAWPMVRGGWSWGPEVVAALGGGPAPGPAGRIVEGLRVWQRLPEWQERGGEPQPGNSPVEPAEAEARLARLVGPGAEDRPQQRAYAGLVAAAFQPRDHRGQPRFVLAEAGTGVGKTLGYLAPASLWAEKNGAGVWISTFTRNLQRQLDGELDRLYPDRREKERNAVVRKGRENYLCLLNFDDAVRGLSARGAEAAVALGLMARWAAASRDGDMVGGDFPAWLADLGGRVLTVDLTDTRGECVYSACRHYAKCFIEHTVRRARRAEIVVANHALVMIQAALGGGDEGTRLRPPAHYVFDEGHHLFEAADCAFSAALTGREAEELRRWLLGAEGRRRSRSRGLEARIGDLIAGDATAAEALAETLRAARALPAAGWHGRVAAGTAAGPAEAFLGRVRQQVYARAAAAAYDLETEPRPPVAGLMDAAAELEAALARLAEPLKVLEGALAALLDARAGELDSAGRARIEAVGRSLERRAVLVVQAWRSMLQGFGGEPAPEFVEWFAVERADGRDLDVGFHRHWIDPMAPFAEVVVAPAQGVLVTSATLRDGSGDDETDWVAAEARTGARHLDPAARRVAVASPFDYGRLTRVLVVTDVDRDDARQVAAAYRELFLAAGGGALGLFTAIARLRAVYDRIAVPLEEAGIALLAQHVDVWDTGTLIDVFRAEEDSCLLGTDAVRDGIDVPGRSLRLIVFDRVPWPRPDILHRARREAFGGRTYDEMLTRLRLKQAFGRLVRRADDLGVFVMLDRALPSRLLGAFPDGVETVRLGLAEAVARVRGFLGRESGP